MPCPFTPVIAITPATHTRVHTHTHTHTHNIYIYIYIYIYYIIITNQSIYIKGNRKTSHTRGKLFICMLIYSKKKDNFFSTYVCAIRIFFSVSKSSIKYSRKNKYLTSNVPSEAHAQRQKAPLLKKFLRTKEKGRKQEKRCNILIILSPLL